MNIVTREEAIASGLKRYCTGIPCKNGHVAQRWTSSKKCFECERLDRAAHPEVRKARNDKWYAKNPEKAKELIRKRMAAWRARNPDKVKQQHIERYLKDPDKERARSVRRRRENPEAVAASYKKWLEKDPERAALIYRCIKHARRSRILTAGGKFTRADVMDLMKRQHGKCAYCHKSLKKEFQIDHIIPVSKGGTNWPNNIQLVCPQCNAKKNAKLPEIFAREHGLLL